MKQRRVVAELPVNEGDTFELAYIHSSEKTPIHDFFEVNTLGSITLKEERFDWYAVGLESHPGYGEVKILPDGRETRVLLDRIFDPLPIRVGWVANQVIRFKGREIVLNDITEPGDLLHISIIKK